MTFIRLLLTMLFLSSAFASPWHRNSKRGKHDESPEQYHSGGESWSKTGGRPSHDTPPAYGYGSYIVPATDPIPSTTSHDGYDTPPLTTWSSHPASTCEAATVTIPAGPGKTWVSTVIIDKPTTIIRSYEKPAVTITKYQEASTVTLTQIASTTVKPPPQISKTVITETCTVTEKQVNTGE